MFIIENQPSFDEKCVKISVLRYSLENPVAIVPPIPGISPEYAYSLMQFLDLPYLALKRVVNLVRFAWSILPDFTIRKSIQIYIQCQILPF